MLGGLEMNIPVRDGTVNVGGQLAADSPVTEERGFLSLDDEPVS